MAPAGRRRRARVSADELAQYGSVAGGTVNVERAARGLGVSKREVRQAIRQAEAAQSNTFFRRMSGRRDADVAEGASIRGMLQAAYGRGHAVGRSTRGPQHRISVYRPARFAVGQLELNDRRRLT
jgi:DNA-binding transcriptional regulator YdaS (Cro superfamily)